MLHFRFSLILPPAVLWLPPTPPSMQPRLGASCPALSAPRRNCDLAKDLLDTGLALACASANTSCKISFLLFFLPLSSFSLSLHILILPSFPMMSASPIPTLLWDASLRIFPCFPLRPFLYFLVSLPHPPLPRPRDPTSQPAEQQSIHVQQYCNVNILTPSPLKPLAPSPPRLPARLPSLPPPSLLDAPPMDFPLPRPLLPSVFPS